MGSLCCKRDMDDPLYSDVEEDNDKIEVYTQTKYPIPVDSEDPESNQKKFFVSSSKYSIDSFHKIALLGKGTFGKVLLVKDKENSNYYAMKILNKKIIREREQETHTATERLLLQKINHPFIVQLYYAFQDEDYLYLILDFAQGGELFYHLHRETFFTNERMQFYAAELVIVLEHLHSKGYIYRDIKPENILLDKEGHIKLTDFGLSKKLGKGEDKNKAYTICGTYDYLAPEIVSDSGYDMTVDWWSLGALMYEMLSGHSPFKQKGKKFSKKVWEQKVEMQNNFTDEAKDILSKLLVVNPKKRLGYGKNGVKNIKSHPFFKNINWKDLEEKKVEPPFVPYVQDPEDVSNFDKYFTSQKITDDNINQSMTEEYGEKDIYEGFSYTGGKTQILNQSGDKLVDDEE